MKNLLGKAVGLIIGDTKINVSIYEDSSQEFILEDTLPPQFTPWSKRFASKTI